MSVDNKLAATLLQTYFGIVSNTVEKRELREKVAGILFRSGSPEAIKLLIDLLQQYGGSTDFKLYLADLLAPLLPVPQPPDAGSIRRP